MRYAYYSHFFGRLFSEYKLTLFFSGRNGLEPVPFTCAAPQGASISFWWREWPNYQETGAIDSSHMGPCAVYVKQVYSASEDSGSGDGWFKIWDEGYDEAADKWCTEKLIDNEGFLTVNLPEGLPEGEYLVRPELLALHASVDAKDPQFYVGCAQLFISGSSIGTLEIPSEYKVTIPGYVEPGSEGLEWNVWTMRGQGYNTPGPASYAPSSVSSIFSASAFLASSLTSYETYDGGVPDTCIVTNGNWCGTEVPTFSDETGCWSSTEGCWTQAESCYEQALPMGHRGCDVMHEYCKKLQAQCNSEQFEGPTNAGAKLETENVEVPAGVSLVAWDTNEEVNTEQGTTTGGADIGDDEEESNEVPDPAPTEIEPEETEATAPEETEPSPGPSAPEEETEDGGYYGGEENEQEQEQEQDGKSPENSSPNLVISKDGRCGGTTGQTCEGSEFGSCCSQHGYCGKTRLYCGCRCNSLFGVCN